MPLVNVGPGHIDDVLAYIKAGGRVVNATYTRTTVIDRKTLHRFEAAGQRVLWQDADGKGYRMARGRSSVYLFGDGGLSYVVEPGAPPLPKSAQQGSVSR